MATSGPTTIVDHITCGICLEVYKNPHALKCLHTYCYNCIHGLKQGSKVQCPDCRKSTDIKDVQKEFKIQSMIDFHHNFNVFVREKSNRKSTGKLCEVCKVSEKEVRSFCKTCEEYMCEDCERAHKGSKATKRHNLMAYDAMYISKKQELEKHIKRLQKEKALLLTSCKETGQDKKNIKVTQRQQLLEINKKKETLKSQIDDHYSKITYRVKAFNSQKSGAMEKCEQLLQECEQDLETKIGYLSEIVQCHDIDILNNTLHHLDEMTAKILHNSKKHLQTKEAWTKSSIEVKYGPTWDPAESINVKVVGDEKVKEDLKTPNPDNDAGTLYSVLVRKPASPEKSPVKHQTMSQMGTPVRRHSAKQALTDYDEPGSGIVRLDSPMPRMLGEFLPDLISVEDRDNIDKILTGKGQDRRNREEANKKIIHTRYKQMKNQKIRFLPRKVCFFWDEIWCAAGEEGILVYSSKGQQVSHIQDESFYNITGIAKTEDGEIIASDSHYGIMLLDSTGMVLQFLNHYQGFCDVHVSGGTLYALQCEKCKIYVYTSAEDSCTWKKKMEFSLPYNCGSWSDTLVATNVMLMVCSNSNDCVYVLHSESGTLMFKFGTSGSGSNPGELQNPFLSDVDHAGNALLCDHGNDRLQTYNVNTKQWRVLLQPQAPTSAAITMNAIWVGTQPQNVSNKLLRYASVE